MYHDDGNPVSRFVESRLLSSNVLLVTALEGKGVSVSSPRKADDDSTCRINVGALEARIDDDAVEWTGEPFRMLRQAEEVKFLGALQSVADQWQQTSIKLRSCSICSIPFGVTETSRSNGNILKSCVLFRFTVKTSKRLQASDTIRSSDWEPDVPRISSRHLYDRPGRKLSFAIAMKQIAKEDINGLNDPQAS